MWSGLQVPDMAEMTHLLFVVFLLLYLLSKKPHFPILHASFPYRSKTDNEINVVHEIFIHDISEILRNSEVIW